MLHVCIFLVKLTVVGTLVSWQSVEAVYCDETGQGEAYGAPVQIVAVASDSTGRRWTTIDVELSNNSSRSSLYRVALRSCQGGTHHDVDGAFAMVPSGGTQFFLLRLRQLLPQNRVRCLVQVVGLEEGALVASRGVIIQRQQRCVCVWRCPCRCLPTAPVAVENVMVGFLLVLVAGLTTAVLSLFVRCVLIFDAAKRCPIYELQEDDECVEVKTVDAADSPLVVV